MALPESTQTIWLGQVPYALGMKTKTQNLGAYWKREFCPRMFGIKYSTFKLNREVLGES